MVFLLCAYVTVYTIHGKFQKMFDNENDVFSLEFLLVSAIGLSFLENSPGDPLDFLRLPRICVHPAPALYNQQEWRGQDHYYLVPGLSWAVASTLPS